MNALYQHIMNLAQQESVGIKLPAQLICKLLNQLRPSELKTTVENELIRQVKDHVDREIRHEQHQARHTIVAHYNPEYISKYLVTTEHNVRLYINNKQQAVDWAIQQEANGSSVRIFNNETNCVEYESPV